MRRTNQSALALLSLACIVLLAACGSSAPVLQYVTIKPSTATASVGGTFNFTAQAYYSNGSVQDGTSLVTCGTNQKLARIDCTSLGFHTCGTANGRAACVP